MLHRPLLLMGFLWLLASSCEKEKDDLPEQEKYIPVLSTTAVLDITKSTAISGGLITDDGGDSVTIRGVCWSTSQDPTIDDNKTIDGSGKGSFTSSLTGLAQGTDYYLRAYASNNMGTGYGSSIMFTTLDDLTDLDGNVYQTIVIGTQEWMAENLKTTKLNDGVDLPNVTDNIAWGGMSSTGAYCYYMNDAIGNAEVYGALYNWFAVGTGKLCPTGWHVPTDEEWDTLIDYLGGETVAGGKMKATGTSLWNPPNSMADNESGFTAIPGGYRNNVGGFEYTGWIGAWWSATESNAGRAYGRDVAYNDAFVAKPNFYKQNGVSVRCVKD